MTGVRHESEISSMTMSICYHSVMTSQVLQGVVAPGGCMTAYVGPVCRWPWRSQKGDWHQGSDEPAVWSNDVLLRCQSLCQSPFCEGLFPPRVSCPAPVPGVERDWHNSAQVGARDVAPVPASARPRYFNHPHTPSLRSEAMDVDGLWRVSLFRLEGSCQARSGARGERA